MKTKTKKTASTVIKMEDLPFSHRVDILALIECKNSILNGDPNNEGAQRQSLNDLEFGIASPGSIKRIVRDYISMKNENNELPKGNDVRIRTRESNLEELREKEEKNKKKGQALVDHVYETYVDTRMFGLTVGKNDFSSLGPIQLEWAETLHPIQNVSEAITSVISYNNDSSKANRTIGRVNRVPYGLFKLQGTINATVGKKTKLTKNDVMLFIDGLWNGFQELKSTVRCGNDTVLLVAFQHDNLRGNCKPRDCYSSLSIESDIDEQDYASKLDNYEVTLDHSKLPKGVKILDLRHSNCLKFTQKNGKK